MGKNRNNLIVNIIGILFIIPFYYITNGSNIFLYVLSYSLYLILINVFSHIKIGNLLKKYNNYPYVKSNIYKKTLINILLISGLIMFVTTLAGYGIEKLFKIEGITVVYFSMSLTIFCVPYLNILKEYLDNCNYKLLAKKIINIYYLLNVFFLLIISILVFRVFNLGIYYSISLLYLSHLLSILVIYEFLSLFVFRRKKNKTKITREEYKVDTKKEIKEVLCTNIHVSIVNMVKYTYYYLSILFLYLILINRYNYSYEAGTKLINNTYFYAIRIMLIVVVITMYLSRNILKRIKEKIECKDYKELSISINSFISLLLRILLTTIIVIIIISQPIWVLLFGNIEGTSILMFLISESLFLVFYIITVKILLSLNNKKNVYISVFCGIIVKLILILPLVDSFYRMGYNLVYGDILSSIISYLVAAVVGFVFINKKIKLNFLHNFENYLMIIYDNIILSLVLILLNILVPTNTVNRLNSIVVIIIYLLITIIYSIIRKRLKKISR